MCRVVLCIFLSIILQIDTYKVSVTVKQGIIIGTTEATVFNRKHYYAFYGVPYAQPPYKKLRFKDPKPLKKWKYPLDARTEFHGACAQAHIVHKHAMYGNEDCLNLNIYTPQLPKQGNEILKAVIVWVHGYAFTSSFSHIYGPDFLIDNDVLFVSVTHRLGAFGFLKVNETDSNANMGLKDIVIALKWIKRNIKKFGGDNKKITVMGSDSGATFLSLLLTTKFKKLFSKMILQSGGIFSPSIFQSDHTIESTRLINALKKLGQKDVTKAPPVNIITTSSKIYNNIEMINLQKSLIPFCPIIEKQSNNSLLVKKPEEFSKSKYADLNIPILIGFNSRESISEVIPFLHNPHYLKSLSMVFKFMVPFMDGCEYKYTSKTYKEISETIKYKYFKDGITEKSIESFLKYTSDIRIFPIYRFIQDFVNSNNKNKMHVYKFNYVGKFNAVRSTSMAGAQNLKIKGAASGDEICYILKCEPLWENYVHVRNNTENRDRKFIKVIAEMWANFAKTGDPTPSSNSYNVTWHPMTAKEDNILLIGKEIKLVNTRPEKKMFAFWNEVYDKYYSYHNCNNKKKHYEL